MKLSRILPITVFTLMLSPLADADNQRRIDVDSKVVTQHKAKINGQRFNYTVATGTQPVWDDKGDAVATLQYTYYTRDKVDDRAKRPLLLSLIHI